MIFFDSLKCANPINFSLKTDSKIVYFDDIRLGMCDTFLHLKVFRKSIEEAITAPIEMGKFSMEDKLLNICR